MKAANHVGSDLETLRFSLLLLTAEELAAIKRMEPASSAVVGGVIVRVAAPLERSTETHVAIEPGGIER